jgi:formate dehydrogenase
MNISTDISAASDSRELKPGQTRRKTFCRICTAFCGLEVITDGKQIDRILPDKDNTWNWRDFCLKGGSAHKVRDHAKRITRPMKRVGDRYVEVSYEQAIKEIAAHLNAIRARHGANAIATYNGNPGQSNGTGTAFMGGFLAGLGSTNNYHVGSVDQNSFNLNGEQMYGCEMTILVPDVDHAKCFLFLGLNPAVSYMGWLDTVADGWNRILAAQANGADLIVVDPRETPTTRKANTHVKIRPNEDWALLLGIIKVIFARGWENKEDCAAASNIDVLKKLAADADLENLANRCNVPVVQIEDIARRFATAPTGVCVARTGVSQSRNGMLGEWLSHALNLICGRTDRKGGRFYNPGIFKNTMKTLNSMAPKIERRSRIGNYRAIYGGYPLATLPDEITTPGEGQVRALIIHCGNPVVAGPDGARLDAALEKLELLISIDMFQRESHRHAHWLIPGCHFLEREEFLTILGSLFEKPHAQLGQAVIEPRDGLWPEWKFFRELALEMNIPFMGMKPLNTIIRMSKRVARLTGNPLHEFNPRWMWALLVKTSSSLKWKDLCNKPSGYIYGEKTYGNFRPQLQTPDGKINAAPAMFVEVLKKRLLEPLPQTDTIFPLRLVNQRRLSMMNSWLVESVKRKEIYGEFVEINPQDAAARGVSENQPVVVQSRVASVTAKARITDEVPPGVISMDHGWGSRMFDPVHGGAPEVQGVNRNSLVPADELDDLTGVPNLNGTSVNVRAA